MKILKNDKIQFQLKINDIHLEHSLRLRDFHEDYRKSNMFYDNYNESAYLNIGLVDVCNLKKLLY